MDFTEADSIALDRELARDGLRAYLETAWDTVEPAIPFVGNWHVDAICDHLEAVRRGDIKRLVINVPPGTGKSLSCCVFFPTWTWTDEPQRKFITASYAGLVSKRDSLRARQLLESKWWRDRWGQQMAPNSDMWTAAHYKNQQGGFRLGVTVSGSVMGEHGDIQIVDDPLKPLEVDGKSAAVTDTALQKASVWWRTTMTSRLVSIKDSARIIIMQRLHEGDLAGEAVAAGYEHLLLPMAYEAGCGKTTSIGWSDPREEEGELLFPERFPEEDLELIESELGARAYAAQYQQRPTPKGGNIFKETDFKYYTTEDHPIPGVPTIQLSKLDHQIQSWDCTFKETANGSYVVGQVWAQTRGKQDLYLLDQVRDRWGLTGTCDALKGLTVKWPRAYRKLVENKANGPAVEDALRDKVTGIVLVEPGGGKEERAHAAEPTVSGGLVWLPHKAIAPWVVGFVSEATQFPVAARDDQVDTMTQAIYISRLAG